MKLLKTFAPTFLLLLFCITSCNIEPYEDGTSQENNEINTEPGTFKVDFDNKTYVADITSATILDNVINISGLRSSSQDAVVITLFANTLGTYPLGVTKNQVEVNGVAYIDPGTGNVWSAVKDFATKQGEVTITEIDEVNKTVSGTFFFTGYNTSQETKEFVNGVFTKISYSADAPTSNNDNTFSAKVAGVEFIEDGIGGALLSIPGTPSIITISATKTSLETISISVSADIAAGTYEFSTFDIPMGQYNLSLTEGVVSERGTLTITSHDTTNKRIIGAFSFKASPIFGTGSSYEITEGSFDVTYL